MSPEPTHKHKHTLDVIVTRDTDELINGISVDRTTFTKDHFMVNCSVNLSKPPNHLKLFGLSASIETLIMNISRGTSLQK